SCSDVVVFACVILSLLVEDNLCAYDCYVNIMWVCPIVNALAGRLLGAYDLRVATPRALVHVGDETSGDARSCDWVSFKHTSSPTLLLTFSSIIFRANPTDIFTFISSYADSKGSIEEVVTETMMKPTLGGYIDEVRADYGSNNTTPRFNKKAKFEGYEYLKILRDNALNRTNGDDVVDHTSKVLAIIELIKTPNVDPNQLRMHAFPLSLTGAARKCDDIDDDPDYLDFINWLNSKFRNHRRRDVKTKNTLWELWIKGGDDEVLMDDIVSSDDEREESRNTNHPNDNVDSFFKPYLDAK
nr:hypothetical protein [Tanacetum cinerariifolium]